MMRETDIEVQKVSNLQGGPQDNKISKSSLRSTVALIAETVRARTLGRNVLLVARYPVVSGVFSCHDGL
jgi:hypothetical protein